MASPVVKDTGHSTLNPNEVSQCLHRNKAPVGLETSGFRVGWGVTTSASPNILSNTPEPFFPGSTSELPLERQPSLIDGLNLVYRTSSGRNSSPTSSQPKGFDRRPEKLKGCRLAAYYCQSAAHSRIPTPEDPDVLARLHRQWWSESSDDLPDLRAENRLVLFAPMGQEMVGPPPPSSPPLPPSASRALVLFAGEESSSPLPLAPGAFPLSSSSPGTMVPEAPEEEEEERRRAILVAMGFTGGVLAQATLNNYWNRM
ncbi:hypothetical protein HYFRA_00011723 [Hymenoscyphus fraxineus]|uniref:Uncharacterized protein n=1 Tax=Hymenoscyphus fraxineus TaxID=746836 RepID=A0A9N9L606_9HELO|nr:hypothetical protein HYFRA_00011723 [Hymenoscyphus fraxineus]